MTTKNKSENIFLRMHPLHRVAISLLLSAVIFLIVRKNDLDILMKLMILWDVFAISYIITAWIVFFTHSKPGLKQHAGMEDGSRAFVFLIILMASFISMIMVLLLLLSKNAAESSMALYLTLAIAGMLLSWGIVHTTFAFHYAHLYYKDNPKDLAEGLDFPGKEEPDYLDFAYFSFVVGMTFQVSDVEITSKIIRRLALVHGLLSFVLNTFVVALTINLIAGLRN